MNQFNIFSLIVMLLHLYAEFISFNITTTLNIHHMFNDGLNGMHKKNKYMIVVGASTLCFW